MFVGGELQNLKKKKLLRFHFFFFRKNEFSFMLCPTQTLNSSVHIPSSLKFCRACQVVMEFYRRPGRKKIFIAEAGYISWDVNVMEISDMLYLIHLMLRKPCYCLWFSQLSIIGYAIIILVLMYPFGRSEFSGMLLSFAVLILLALSLKSKIIWLISYSNMVCFV